MKIIREPKQEDNGGEKPGESSENSYPPAKTFFGFTIGQWVLTVFAGMALTAYLLYPWLMKELADVKAQVQLTDVAYSQKVFYADNEEYTDDISKLPEFTPMEKVIIELSVSENNQTWSGTSRHEEGERVFSISSKDGGIMHGRD